MKAINSIKLNELKVVYFDVDGVLSIPRYPLGKNGEIIPFAEYETWKTYFYDNKGTYDNCKAPKDVYDWILQLKDNGILVRTLSVSTTFESEAKLKFINNNYGDLIDSNVLVDNVNKKIDELFKAQKEFNCDKFEIALVEDNHYTLFDVAKNGFRGVHISWFMESIY